MSTSHAQNQYLDELIESARPFLHEDLESVVKNLPTLLIYAQPVLVSAGIV